MGSKRKKNQNEKIDVCETLMPPFPNILRIGLTFDLGLSPTNLNIDRGHLLMMNYLPTKFEAFRENHSWVISCTRCERSLTVNLAEWLERQAGKRGVADSIPIVWRHIF